MAHLDIAQPQQPVPASSPGPKNALRQLAALHSEAEETAHLANLLGRTVPFAIVITGLCAATFAFGGDTLPEGIAWAVLVLLGVGAMARVYSRTMVAPFARGPLQAFGADIMAILLYAGFAWGAGAFLALPQDAGIAAVILFAVAPAIAVAVLLRERNCLNVFLAPAAALTAFASLLRPFPDGALDAALVLLAAAAVVGVARLAERHSTPDIPGLAGLV